MLEQRIINNRYIEDIRKSLQMIDVICQNNDVYTKFKPIIDRLTELANRQINASATVFSRTDFFSSPEEVYGSDMAEDRCGSPEHDNMKYE